MGEGAKFALAREIKEEIGADVTVGQFRGATFLFVSTHDHLAC